MGGNKQNIPGGCLSRLRKVYSSLRPTEKKVADYILKHHDKVLYCTITELSAYTDTSDATIIRFCRLLGYNGYQDLKIALAREVMLPSKNIHEDITPSDTFETAVKKVFQANIQAISDTAEIVNVDTLKKSVDAIVNARRVYVYGVGTSGLAAQDLCYKLLRVGIHADFYVDSHMQSISTALLEKDDVVIGISHSGSTKETVEVLTQAKEQGVKIICITNYSRSPMGKLGDLILLTAAEETPFGSGGMPSIMAQLSVIDCLFVGIALDHYDEALSFIERTGLTVKNRKY